MILVTLLIFLLSACHQPGNKNNIFSFIYHSGDAPALVSYARGFDISYQKGYRIVSVYNPWQGATDVIERYYLVDKNSSIPDNLKNKTVIGTPVSRVVCLSTTHIALVDFIGKTNTIVGISGGSFVNNEKLRKLINEKKIADVGYDKNLNIELLISLHPDLVVAYGVESNITGILSRLRDLGIPVVINAEYLEETPLGKAEWVKFIAAFYNEEALAEKKFVQIRDDYLKLTEMAAKVISKPKVLTGLPWNNTWYVPGGRSYAAQLISDAGGTYLWNEDQSRESIALSIESAYEKGKYADVWINNGDANSLRDILNNDERLSMLPAFKNAALYNNNARLNIAGGNDYWESGIVSPQVILKDLIAIFHPTLFPGYHLIYYKKLTY
ncbi:MAG: ABC transporter substrate-binding protein [Bacteroidia bacterium]|nr:ABC transporter substrate-binding protein [Bacteroidia bacterium]